MATGDITLFNAAKKWEGDGTFDFDTNTFKLAILENTVVPSATDTNPKLADYTEVTAAGTYTAGGTALTTTYTESSGTVTFNSSTNPTWAADANNTTTAYWGLIYQSGTFNGVTDAALCFIDLGGPIDMVAGDLTVTLGDIFTKS